MRQHIKNCPFCGSEARIEDVNYQWRDNYDSPIRISCVECFCKTDYVPSEIWEFGKGTFSIREKVEAELIKKWNERV